MPILYYPVQRKDPKTGELKWYPQKKALRGVGLKQIADDIAELAGVSPGDTYDVVINMPTVIRRYLRNGQPINLDGLGTLNIWLRATEGRNTAAEVDETQIKPFIHFRATQVRNNLRKFFYPILKGLSYTKEMRPTAAFRSALEEANDKADKALTDLVSAQNILEEMKIEGASQVLLEEFAKIVERKQTILDKANQELCKFEVI